MRATVRKPCATVRPNGPAAARSGSVWIHWWSSVASAKTSMRCWSTVTQSLVPRSSPTAARSSSTSLNFRMRGSWGSADLEVGGDLFGLADERDALGGGPGQGDEVHGGDARGRAGLEALGDVGARPDQRHRSHQVLGQRGGRLLLLAVEVEVL